MIRAADLLLCLTFAVGLAACDLPGAPKKEPGIVYVQPDNAEMNAAIAEARRTLPEFWAHLPAPPAGDSDFMVKVEMPVSGSPDGGEHLWMDHVRRDGDNVSGTLINEPELLPALHKGAEVRVPVATISDWGYLKEGKYYGNYTTRVMVKHMPPQEVAQTIAPDLASSPLEPGSK